MCVPFGYIGGSLQTAALLSTSYIAHVEYAICRVHNMTVHAVNPRYTLGTHYVMTIAPGRHKTIMPRTTWASEGIGEESAEHSSSQQRHNSATESRAAHFVVHWQTIASQGKANHLAHATSAAPNHISVAPCPQRSSQPHFHGGIQALWLPPP